jgi:hypothetical protein
MAPITGIGVILRPARQLIAPVAGQKHALKRYAIIRQHFSDEGTDGWFD